MKYNSVICLVFVLIHLSRCASIGDEDACSNSQSFERIDCHPDGSPNESSCTSRGCCWSPVEDPHDPNEPGVPFCFFSQTFVNYDIKHKVVSANKIVLLLTRRTQTNTGFSKNVDTLLVDVTGITGDTARVQITDATNKRFQVPDPQPNIELIKQTSSSNAQLYNVDLVNGSVLDFQRIFPEKRTILHIDLSKLVYADQYIQVPITSLPTSSLYGFGEHYENFKIDFNASYKRLIFLNRDAPPTKYLPAYGTHPFYLMKDGESSHLFHGIHFFNNHISEVTLVPSKKLWYRTLGGIVDMFVFFGPGANDVISTKNRLIGLPAMPPFWSLGFHLCRYGYKSTAHLNETLRRNQAAGVPVDVQWVDIDAMDRRNDFTLGENFKDLKDLVDQLHREGLFFVPIIDPAVSGSEEPNTYPPYDLGKELDIFIKSPFTNQPFIAKVWNPKTSLFPDFTHPLSDIYWSRLMNDFYKIVPFDGLWIDMNEPANMIDGEMNRGCPANSTYDHPQFDPSVRNGHFIYKKTICMSCPQYLGLHYDLHNMYSFYESLRTWNALETIRPRKRHFILSRASVSGQGKYAFHWTGDVFSTWPDLRQSISDILNFNLFGIPMVGADICGFNGETNTELCARWSSLGAFYPFSRNHNSIDSPDQDPAALGPDVVKAAKFALNIRYQLLPYLYTQFYHSSMVGLPVARSLALEYPLDPEAASIDTQFLLGPAIMVSPVVEENVRVVKPYFPKNTTWYNFVDRKVIVDSSSPYRRIEIPCNLTEISVAIKRGHVVPTFSNPQMSVIETVKKSAYTLIVAPDENGNATGSLFADSGDEPIDHDDANISFIVFHVYKKDSKFILVSKPHKNRFQPDAGQTKFVMDKMIFFNFTTVHSIKVAGETFAFNQNNFDGDSYILTGLKQDLNKPWIATWG